MGRSIKSLYNPIRRRSNQTKLGDDSSPQSDDHQPVARSQGPYQASLPWRRHPISRISSAATAEASRHNHRLVPSPAVSSSEVPKTYSEQPFDLDAECEDAVDEYFLTPAQVAQQAYATPFGSASAHPLTENLEAGSIGTSLSDDGVSTATPDRVTSHAEPGTSQSLSRSLRHSALSAPRLSHREPPSMSTHYIDALRSAMRNTPSNLPRSYMILPTSSHDRPATDHPYHSHSSSAYGPTDSVDTSIDSDLPTSTYRLLPLPRIPAFDDQVHSRSSDISNNRVLPPFGTSTSVPPGFGTGAAEGLDHGNYSAHWTFDLDL